MIKIDFTVSRGRARSFSTLDVSDIWLKHALKKEIKKKNILHGQFKHQWILKGKPLRESGHVTSSALQSRFSTHPGVAVSGSRNNDEAQKSDSVGLIALCNLLCNLLAVSHTAITVRCPADYGRLLCFRDRLMVGWLTQSQIVTEDTWAYRHANTHAHTDARAGREKVGEGEREMCVCIRWKY